MAFLLISAPSLLCSHLQEVCSTPRTRSMQAWNAAAAAALALPAETLGISSFHERPFVWRWLPGFALRNSTTPLLKGGGGGIFRKSFLPNRGEYPGNPPQIFFKNRCCGGAQRLLKVRLIDGTTVVPSMQRKKEQATDRVRLTVATCKSAKFLRSDADEVRSCAFTPVM